MWPFSTKKECQCDIVRKESSDNINEVYKDLNRVKNEHTELRLTMTSEIAQLRSQDEKIYSEVQHLVGFLKDYISDSKKDNEKMDDFREDVRTSIAEIHEGNTLNKISIQKMSRLGWLMLGTIFTVVSSVVILMIKMYLENQGG